jgi:hypothetical protein
VNHAPRSWLQIANAAASTFSASSRNGGEGFWVLRPASRRSYLQGHFMSPKPVKDVVFRGLMVVLLVLLLVSLLAHRLFHPVR